MQKKQNKKKTVKRIFLFSSGMCAFSELWPFEKNMDALNYISVYKPVLYKSCSNWGHSVL